MRFHSLHLQAYGHFTDARLSFEGCGFHIVFGPNEAGKSTTLRAVKALLYGVPHHCPDAFLHDTASVRLGGILENAAGERLEFMRRKGKKNTLLAADGKAPLSETALDPFLGGVGEETFSLLYGLDHMALVRGGDSLLEVSGQVGESLFAAGSGLTGLRTLLGRLEDEAAALYKPPRGGAILGLLRDYADARRRVSEATLRVSSWEKLEREVHAAETALAELRQAELDLRKSEARSSRLRQTLSVLGRRRQLIADLESLAGAVDLPADATEKRLAAESEQRIAAELVERLTSERRALEAGLLDLGSESESTLLLRQEARVAELQERLAEFRSYLQKEPPIAHELKLRELEAARLTEELGTAATTQRLSVAQRERVLVLAEAQPQLVQRLADRTESARMARVKWQRLHSDYEALPPNRDVATLKQALERFRSDVDETFAAARARAQAAGRAAIVAYERLGLWPAGPAAEHDPRARLAASEIVAIPSLQTINRFEHLLRDLGSREQAHKARSERLRSDYELARLQLDKLQLEAHVPNESDLGAARDHRQIGWRLVRAAWRGGERATEDESAYTEGADLADTFEAAVDKADAIVDRLRREADRVARRAGLEADIRRFEVALCEARAVEEALTREAASIQTAWRDVWNPTGLEPLPPAEMREWTGRFESLLKAIEEWRACELVAAGLGEQRSQRYAEVRAALIAVGTSPPNESQDFASLLQFAQHELTAAIEAEGRRIAAHKALWEAQDECDRTASEQAAAEAALANWREQWSQVVSWIGLEPSASAREAMAVVARRDELARVQEQVQEKSVQLSQARAYIEVFKRETAEILLRLGQNVGQESADASVMRLAQAMAQAKKKLASREEYAARLSEKHEQEAAASGRMRAAAATLASLRAAAGCADLVELVQAEQVSQRKQALRTELSQLDEQLLRQGDGRTVGELLAEAGESSTEEATIALDQTREALSRTSARREEQALAAGSLRNQLETLKQSEGATLALDDCHAILARIATASESYAKARLASLLLKQTIERYRARNQDPLLARAGELFAQLTLGVFRGLDVDYDERDTPILTGVRQGGAKLAISGMSDGTRDQLFLALRLASIERQAERSEPLPLIVDDLLINFDDERSAATLSILGELSAKVQVLFFTHHHRLCELAVQRLPKGSFKVHDLVALTAAGPRA